MQKKRKSYYTDKLEANHEHMDAIKNFWLTTRHTEKASICIIKITHPSKKKLYKTYLTDHETEAKCFVSVPSPQS